MGQTMASVWQQIEGLRLAGVADVAPASIRLATAQGIPCCEDYRQLLEQPLDGVYIASPNALHREHLLAAIERRLPVLCEKPVATNLVAAREMARAADRAHVPVVVDFVYRFTDAYERLRAYHDGGKLGVLLACWFRTFRGFGSYRSGARHPAVVHPEASGGWAVHHSIHAVDWLVSIGGPVAAVSARTIRSTLDAPCEEGVFGQLYFRSGAVGQLADAALALREHPAGIMGTLGSATYDQAGTVRLCLETGVAETCEETRTPATAEGGHAAVARHFVEVMRGQAPPRVTLHDGCYALEVVQALLEADRTNSVVSVPEGSEA